MNHEQLINKVSTLEERVAALEKTLAVVLENKESKAKPEKPAEPVDKPEKPAGKDEK